MSENSSNNSDEKSNKKPPIKWRWLLILPVWTMAAFYLAQFILLGVQWLLLKLGVSFGSINPVLLTTTLSVLVYALAIAIVIGVPYFVWRRRTTKKELGVPDLPSWMDILLTVPAYFVYMICSGVMVLIAMNLLPMINFQQEQQLPFSQNMLGTQGQYILAFLTLVVLAPLAEELLFRGYLYGKLRRSAPVWLAVAVVSLSFGAAHLWAGGENLQWAVAIDTMVLSIVLCILREYTGAIWASVLVHAVKNGLAFYLLFINPDILNQIKSAVLPFL